jgi:NADPH2 dehydrogenase
MANLFSSYAIKDMKLKNRIVMAPMCMYSSNSYGYVENFHLVHYTSRAIGGVGLIILESTAVDPEGRLTDKDLGIWDDSHIEGLKKIVDECHKYGAKVAIQLNHAGRKSTTTKEPIAPSAIKYNDEYFTPSEMTKDNIKRVHKAFVNGVRRANEAGFDAIEIHGAHGYLISEFLSPLTNERTDEYGGYKENRVRFLDELMSEVKNVWPNNKPLMLRISAQDYIENGNSAEDIADMINLMDNKVDIINVSTGGVVDTRVDYYPGYQINHSEIIKNITNIPTIAGGLIKNSYMAEEIIRNNRGDLVFFGRELLRNPYFPLQAANELNYKINWPEQYTIANK